MVEPAGLRDVDPGGNTASTTGEPSVGADGVSQRPDDFAAFLEPELVCVDVSADEEFLQFNPVVVKAVAARTAVEDATLPQISGDPAREATRVGAGEGLGIGVAAHAAAWKLVPSTSCHNSTAWPFAGS